MNKIIGVLVAVAVVGSLSGCATAFDSTDTYNNVQANVVQRVVLATVISARPVHLQSQSSGVGTLAGAGVGGVVGSQIGHGTGSVLGVIGGLGLGAVAGHFAEKAMGSDMGTELTLQVQGTGQNIVVAEKTDEVFKPGETVKIFQPVGPAGTAAKVRVTH